MTSDHTIDVSCRHIAVPRRQPSPHASGEAKRCVVLGGGSRLSYSVKAVDSQTPDMVLYTEFLALERCFVYGQKGSLVKHDARAIGSLTDTG